MSYPRAAEVDFCAFFCAVFAWIHDNTLHGLYGDRKQSLSLAYDHLWYSLSWGIWTSSLIKLWFRVSSIAIILHNAWPSTSNLCSSKAATSRWFWFCSPVTQWWTYRTGTFLLFKSFFRILNADVGGILVTWNDLLQEHLAQVSNFVYLLLFSALLVLDHRLCPTRNCTKVHCELTTNFISGSLCGFCYVKIRFPLMNNN